MRMFNRGIENIKFLMEKHEAEWRREQGEEVELPKLEDFRTPVNYKPKSKAKSKSEGGLDENRFLSKEKKSPKVESVQVLPGAEHHSWLYNEVMKAINDAAAKNKNSRIIAIFVPVLQNSKEFEDLPVDEVVTISSDEANQAPENLPDDIISGIAAENLPTTEILEIAQEITEPAPELESESESAPEIESASEPDNLVFEEIPAEVPENNESEPELIPLDEITESPQEEAALIEAETPAEEVIIIEEPAPAEITEVEEIEELKPISILDENAEDSGDDLPNIEPLNDLDGIEESITEEPELILPADEIIEIKETDDPAPIESSEPESPEIAELKEVELKAPDLEGDEIEILSDPEDDESDEKIKVD